MTSELPDVPHAGLLGVVLWGALWSLASCASSSTVGDAGHDARSVEGEDSGVDGGDAETGVVDAGPIDAGRDACVDTDASCPSRCAPEASADAYSPKAVLADAQVWVIWEARDTGTGDVRSDVCAARYDTSSGKLSNATRLNDNPIVTFASVQSTSSKDGTVAVSWREGDGLDRLLANQLTAQNTAWSPAEAVIPTASLTAQLGTSLAAGADQRATVAWGQGSANDGPSVWATHHVEGDGWLAPTELSPSSYATIPPVVAIDSNGDAFVAWAWEDGVWVNRFDTRADTWLPPEQLTDTPSGLLRIASRGPSTFVSWESCTVDGCTMQLTRRDRENDTWGTSSIPTPSAGSARPDLVVNAEGNALIVWVQSHRTAAGNDLDAVYAARYEVASDTWLAPQPVFMDAMHHGGRPAAALGDDGTAHVAWLEGVRVSPDDHVGHGRLRVSSQATAGAVWTGAELLAEGMTGELMIPDVVWTPEAALVVWAQSDEPGQPAKIQVRRVD